MSKTQAEVDALYRFLHKYIHDNDRAPDLAAVQTADSFGFQWDKLQDGQYMTTDPWFRENVSRILCEQELMLPSEWFPGKRVLDCGCGGGRWSYGLAKLGANVTAVDINSSCISAAKAAMEGFTVDKQFVQSPLETLSEKLDCRHDYDLVFSWGVLHHCQSFTGALKEISGYVKEGGLLYLFLYGYEPDGYGHENELEIFKQRIHYNGLRDWQAQEAFLRTKALNDPMKMNKKHDKLAPLINRRLKFEEVEKMLRGLGYTDVEQTKQCPPTWEETYRVGATHQLFVRAVKGDATEARKVSLPAPEPPYWFWKYRRPEFADRVLGNGHT